jgi:hypothetical protein
MVQPLVIITYSLVYLIVIHVTFQEWKNKLNTSSVVTDNSRHMKTAENFQPQEYTTADFVEWAYSDTMRNSKSTKNFISGIAHRLKSYEDEVSHTILPKLNQKQNP